MTRLSGMGSWRYCGCAGTHEPECPNEGDPDALPPLAGDDDEERTRS